MTTHIFLSCILLFIYVHMCVFACVLGTLKGEKKRAADFPKLDLLACEP